MDGVIAVVVADEDLRQRLEAALLAAGCVPAAFRTSAAFLESLSVDTFDLALTSDVDLVRKVRAGARGEALPLILVTSDTDDDGVVAAVGAGADAFITVSAKPALILARISALRRRTAGWFRRDTQSLGAVAFDPARAVVTIHGMERPLTAKEYKLATLLFDNPHRVLARRYLIEEVWGPSVSPASRTLDTHLSRLKIKLGLTPDRGFNLGPVYGYGYRLTRTTQVRAAAAA